MDSHHKVALRLLPAVLAAAFSLPSAADDSTKKTDGPVAQSNVFTLGEIKVTAHREDENAVGTATLDREALWDFSKDSLPDALNMIPGVATTAGSGGRNESVISVRGFERQRVPLFMDGVRLYLPADARIDFDRFLTPDLSEIQVSRGYVSVINGPDGMGGAINLVTRKPVKPFEGEVRVEAKLGEGGQYNGNTTYADLGGRQDNWYYQVSAEERDQKQWLLSKDFQPTSIENGGVRDHANSNDSRYNLKLGFTPNAVDEYSLNYVTQSGEKHGIGSVVPTKSNTTTVSTWDWPTWDTSSLYWLSKTQVGDKTSLQTKAYYNSFKNTLELYTDTTFSTPGYLSYYEDNSKGFSVELDTEHFSQQTLKAALHWRRDEGTSWVNYPSMAASKLVQFTPSYKLPSDNFTEPKQTTIEDVASLALEDTWHLTPKLDLVGGLSRDARFSKQAQSFGPLDNKSTSPGVLINYTIADSYATNYQTAAIYSYSDSGKVHLSASDRTRFPTMSERFSSKFFGALSNPWLNPERALNVEVGIADDILPGLRGEAALFHSDIKDAIESVTILGTYNGINCTTNKCSQNQNLGTETYKGVEFGLTARISATLDLGGNYSYINTHISNPNDPNARLQTTPQNKALLYAKWQPTEAWNVIPSLEYASSRWSTSAANSALYVQTGAYALLNTKVEYKIRRDWSVSLAARNLLDKNYQVVDGYPQEGRNFLLATRFQF